ncbi:response regulator [Pantoea sp. Tr-811]|uniref:hybrid sensor histidine kinase/response regulator n=1 Tax=Pantoea sp. Tr-811 TaxID=2608361 RepID=UPI00141FE1D4|nr:ATP-binding protein [Pantoea sp. Tr-811]NIF25103.1 response regulator [Pantoea sp. Tr-811]
MGELIAQHDWSTTSLGPLPQWRASLRIAVDMMLMSPFPSAVVWGPDMTVIHNAGYLALLDSPGPVLGQHFDTLWQQHWQSIGPWVYKALGGSANFVEAQPVLIASPNAVGPAWYAFSYTPIRDEMNEVAGFLHTVIDTTDSVDAHARWRDQALAFEGQIHRYMADREQMWKLSRDAMLVVTTDLKIQAANPAWQRILGWQEDQVRDTSILALVHPADRAEVEVAALEFTRGEGAGQLETRLRHADGHYRWFNWTANFDGLLLTAVGRDISAEREEAQRHSQEWLRDAQRLESVGQLAGGMAHEMNNLLSGIAGSLEMLQRRIAQGRTERIEHYVELASDSVQRAMNLTHRLLTFSRYQPLAPKVLELNRQLTDMGSLLQQALGAEMRLIWELDVQPWAVFLDASQLENALVNLCANAREACLGCGELTIRTINRRLATPFPDGNGLPPGDYVALEVLDTGHGMPAQDIAKAFEPFFTTKPMGRGLGLGLSMVYGFVGQSGGHVWIESTPGQGTVVSLLFPRSFEEVVQAPAVQAPAISLASGQRLLLVDDEFNLRTLMREYLRERGFEVFDVADANTAMQRFQHAGPFDLVITDIGLPGGFSGRQLARTMRMLEPSQKILFITGYTEQPLEAQLLESPGTALMLKPFQLQSLANQALLMVKG